MPYFPRTPTRNIDFILSVSLLPSAYPTSTTSLPVDSHLPSNTGHCYSITQPIDAQHLISHRTLFTTTLPSAYQQPRTIFSLSPHISQHLSAFYNLSTRLVFSHTLSPSLRRLLAFRSVDIYYALSFTTSIQQDRLPNLSTCPIYIL
ncbi:hypothetical protein CPB83DRAFT_165046 [Crepidotus variabilis]|uniref:Uncharacterized protein n=1 Tax=Crepidotus variabilis TaxID=179855 RepID=A0A9P6EL01_9AGAR|nr:hypothetical protein CPB83DRAFT_165046 [Crepidotus variabilis]